MISGREGLHHPREMPDRPRTACPARTHRGAEQASPGHTHSSNPSRTTNGRGSWAVPKYNLPWYSMMVRMPMLLVSLKPQPMYVARRVPTISSHEVNGSNERQTLPPVWPGLKKAALLSVPSHSAFSYTANCH